jgi:hypothetical protein
MTSPQRVADADRAEFERWCVSEHGYTRPPLRDGDSYVGAEAKMMWNVWQAARTCPADTGGWERKAAEEIAAESEMWKNWFHREAPDKIAAILTRHSPRSYSEGVSDAVKAINEQIANQRGITRQIKDRREKEIDAARLVGMGDAVLIVQALRGIE